MSDLIPLLTIPMALGIVLMLKWNSPVVGGALIAVCLAAAWWHDRARIKEMERIRERGQE